MHTTDQDLHDYSQQGSPEAFRRIVDRYVSAVHTAAMRVLWQRQPLAEEVTQEVFVLLARKAAALPSSIELGGWLHRQAVRLSLNALRTERRRAAREATALQLHTMNTATDESHRWADVMPHVDAEMLKLSTADQQALALRFFDGCELSDIASALGLSAGAVQKRIARALEALRVRLHRRGVVLSATALGALMSTEFVQASLAPVAATIATQALAATTTATGTALLSTLFAMKMKLALAVGALLLVSAVGYDLASQDSLLARWFGSKSAASPTQITPKIQQAERNTTSDQSSPAERLLAEARDIWAKAGTRDEPGLSRLITAWIGQPVPETQLAVLRAARITISNAAYQSLINVPGGLHGGTRSIVDKFLDLMRAWAKESPREAMAWLHGWHSSYVNDVLWVAVREGRSDPESWAAFLEASPDHDFVAWAKLWQLEEEDPGAAWTRHSEAKVDLDCLRDRLAERIRSESPEIALQALLRSPSPFVRRQAILGLAPRLSSEQLLQLATHEFASETATANVLRLLAGDPGASFSEAIKTAAWMVSFNRENHPGEFGASDWEWGKICCEHIYAAWIKADPAAALEHFGSPACQFDDAFAQAALKSGIVNEQMIVDTFANNPRTRSRALMHWYEAQTSRNPQAMLRIIQASQYLDDQIDSASFVLRSWATETPREAAVWLQSIPANADRVELAAAIVEGWVEVDYEADLAIAFARQEGVPLKADGELTARYASKISDAAMNRFLAQYQGDEHYDTLIMATASNKFGDNADKKFQFIAEHGSTGWQKTLVERFDSFMPADFDSPVTRYVRPLLGLDLGQQDPEQVASAAYRLVQGYNRDDELAQGLSMTLQLPAAAAALARAKAASEIDISTAERRTALMHWIQSASISESERSQLVQVLNQRVNSKPQ